MRRDEKRRDEKQKEDQRRESQKKEGAGARKGRKVAKHRIFPIICGSGGSKSSAQMRDEIVGQSTFRSQNVQSTSASEHF